GGGSPSLPQAAAGSRPEAAWWWLHATRRQPPQPDLHTQRAHDARIWNGGSMRLVLRSILAVLTAFVVACVIMMVIESINGRVLHPELGQAAEGLTDREAIRALFATAPPSAFLVVIFGWVLGSFAGGW